MFTNRFSKRYDSTFVKKRPSILSLRMKSYEYTYSIDCSFFEKCRRDFDRLLHCLENFHGHAANLFTSSLTTASLFQVTTFAYIMICHHFSLVIFHSIYKAVKYGLFYYSNNPLFDSILFPSLFSVIFFNSYSRLCRINPLDMNHSVLNFLLCCLILPLLNQKSTPFSLLWKAV